MQNQTNPTVDLKTVPARLALEDGSVFHGQGFGDVSSRTVDAEVCFNTSITGYQEILTDPSYAGQIVTMTYPLIGNYGTNPADLESSKIQVSGFVVRELANLASNFRSTERLEDWLASQNVTGITGIDTRALTRKLRINGAMNGVITTDTSKSDAELVAEAKASTGLVGKNLAETVSRSETLQWDEDLGDWAPIQGTVERPTNAFRVVAIDCGAKLNILRNLTDSGCDVIVVPWNTSAEEILSHQPNGIFVSNGPGDPAAVSETIETLKSLTGKLPIFGICLGHQLLCLSLGAETYKLKFGHRGGNQPVQNLETGKVEITSQNHGFAVETESLEHVGAEATHINLNDRTLAGFRHNEMPVFAIQYHPEASPGPHDSRYLFDCFIDMMQSGKSPTGEQMDTAQRRRNDLLTATSRDQ
ncbi:Carbamoyl-phosphate synthase small chain [Poriferisphaera corsica]|uniref:Carbamoyl phosphate synthase small chain n=1 Tax=Poriferisphaera corsica TaxID=2528020 RepID=A0A517YV14_9BACT|nr:glutamine-hydrolyzing carbamoyl-phosphate synthase small subunit [Poriferisphaera corsica]QDU34067.1 Carbamoyl-phosphate synthase small chain [Poriferisphaera corsica]